MDDTEKKQGRDEKKQYQKKLRALREERKEVIARNKEIMKAQKKDVSSIKTALSSGARTVPAISKETGLPNHSVLWYITGLVKYGEVEAGHSDGAYLTYRLAEKGK